MISTGWIARLWNNQRTAHIVSYFIVAAMLVCLSIALQQVGENFIIGWQGSYLPWLTFVAALEGMYAQNLLRRRSLTFIDAEFWFFRMAEFVVYFILIRTLLYLLRGSDIFLRDLASWQADWLTFFDDPELIVVMAVLGVLWMIGSSFAEDIDQLQSKPRDVGFDTLAEMQLDRNQAKARVINRILTVGMFLILITVIVRLNLGQIFGETLATEVSTLNVLVYFGLALVLLSMNEYALQRGRWLWERTPLLNNITPRWIRYAGTFLLILIGLAMLLPTIYTVGFLDAVRYLIALVSYVAGLVLFAISTIFSLLYLLYFSIVNGFGEIPTAESQTIPPPEFGFEQAEAVEKAANPFLENIISGAFWISLALIVIVAFVYYIRQNEEFIAKIRSTHIIARITEVWSAFWSFLLQVGQGARHTVRRSYARFQQRLSAGSGFPDINYMSLRKLSAREKIYFYYSALLRRGGEFGVNRKANQTPIDYSLQLRTDLPDDLSTDLETLTEQFLEARYSDHAVDREQVSLVQQAWQHLRVFFRRGDRKRNS